MNLTQSRFPLISAHVPLMKDDLLQDLPFDIRVDQPVLIAGPTASGKSGLALQIAQQQSRPIINADALQVYDGWRILTARPSPDEETKADHHLYGHIPYTQSYSVGAWLRDIAPLLRHAGPAPIIVGGTGLYFRALTEGLADIPAPSPDIRAEADRLMVDVGHERMLTDLDAETLGRIDQNNPIRVQRAWEVQRATGHGLAMWQDKTPPALLPISSVFAIVVSADPTWLNNRIDQRFNQMIDLGALAEAQTMLSDWDPDRLSSRAIGAPELIAHLQGKLPLETAIEMAKIASHQYAKRQRTWMRKRMQDWTVFEVG